MFKSGRMWMVLLGLCVLAGACMTISHVQKPKASRGVVFTHAKHAERGIECATCHTAENEDAPHFAIPKHDVCSGCHEIPADYKEAKDLTTCALCHDRKDASVTPRKAVLSDERKFSHAPHAKKEVACATCHENPDKAILPAGNLMTFCSDCHAKTDAKLTDCTVCHTTLRKDVRPTYRGTSRIAHDSPQIWEHVHGRESKIDPQFCSTCHQTQESCETCHRKNPPSDHTVAWRGKPHGQQAAWNREKCSVCHEEDSCLKCHKNTEPASHRGGWDGPANLHCVSCHYPAEKNDCTVCHERIEHRSAIRSPHDIGLYPAQCGLCHPGGLPHQAPHVMNSTVRCAVCHK